MPYLLLFSSSVLASYSSPRNLFVSHTIPELSVPSHFPVYSGHTSVLKPLSTLNHMSILFIVLVSIHIRPDSAPLESLLLWQITISFVCLCTAFISLYFICLFGCIFTSVQDCKFLECRIF